MPSRVEGSITLAAEPTASREARRWVAQLLGKDPRCEDVILCVSEIVTNAVLHARTPVTLALEVADDGSVRIEATDGSSTLPAVKHHSIAAATGRGMRLVERLADRWGADPSAEGGKVVWFEMAALEPA